MISGMDGAEVASVIEMRGQASSADHERQEREEEEVAVARREGMYSF